MDPENAILALAALAQPTRLDVFRLLVQHEPEGLAAGDIAKMLAVPQNTMSRIFRSCPVRGWYRPGDSAARLSIVPI